MGPKLLILLAFALMALGTGAPAKVLADQAWGPYDDMGRTYQNHWNDDCKWFDEEHYLNPPYPCYQGIWSDSWNVYSDYVQVEEYAFHHYYWCAGGDLCATFYTAFGAYPAWYSGSSYATTSGVHYFCGLYSCNWAVNVRGYARHYNLTWDPYSWFTTSDGYPPSAVDPTEN